MGEAVGCGCTLFIGDAGCFVYLPVLEKVYFLFLLLGVKVLDDLDDLGVMLDGLHAPFKIFWAGIGVEPGERQYTRERPKANTKSFFMIADLTQEPT